MKKHNLRFIFLFLSFCLTIITGFAQSEDKYYYALNVYHLASEDQLEKVDQYLEKAYVPAMHRAGVENVGVFHTIEDEPPKIYVFVPYSSLDQATSIESTLANDQQYQKAGGDYLNAPYDAPPYERIERILLHAFPGMPAPAMPDLNASKSERFYELRSYEGPTEKLYANKVDMFNNGDEVSIFDRLGFNAVFYAEVLYGCRTPNLMYLTTFESQAERDKHWEAFNNDPAWQQLKAKKEYQHNVSKADLIFLRPATYSDY